MNRKVFLLYLWLSLLFAICYNNERQAWLWSPLFPLRLFDIISLIQKLDFHHLIISIYFLMILNTHRKVSECIQNQSQSIKLQVSSLGLKQDYHSEVCFVVSSIQTIQFPQQWAKSLHKQVLKSASHIRV